MVRVVKLGARIGRRYRRSSARKARSSRSWPATNRSRAIGGGPTPTPRRCARAGISPATPASSTRDGDLFVTGRVDDMIITGGENISPVEIESCLSLHAARLRGRRGRACRTNAGARSSPPSSSAARAVEPDELDAFCRTSGLAGFKRPRRYVFVTEIPKSPVGKLLRRKLVAGEYAAQSDAPANPAPHQQGTPV